MRSGHLYHVIVLFTYIQRKASEEPPRIVSKLRKTCNLGIFKKVKENRSGGDGTQQSLKCYYAVQTVPCSRRRRSCAEYKQNKLKAATVNIFQFNITLGGTGRQGDWSKGRQYD